MPDVFPPSPPPAAATVATSNGRLRLEGLPSGERNYAIWIHLSPLLAFLVVGPIAGVVPLVLWLTRRETSAFADDHGKEVVNLCISGIVLFVIGLVTGVGLLLWTVWAIVAAINVIRGSIAASNGEYFRYPMTMRFVS